MNYTYVLMLNGRMLIYVPIIDTFIKISRSVLAHGCRFCNIDREWQVAFPAAVLTVIPLTLPPVHTGGPRLASLDKQSQAKASRVVPIHAKPN